MGILGKLFHTKDAATVPRDESPQGRHVQRTIRHDPALLESLLHDHIELNAIYQRIGKLRQDGHYDEIRAELVNFKTRLEAHILTENVRFYTYLEQSLSDDAHNAEMMRDFRREMNTIARAVVAFVKKYQAAGTFDPSLQAEFARDYQSVGELLKQRLGREESSLYPLYQPD
jgi:hemerythrin-like domain-containing protein